MLPFGKAGDGVGPGEIPVVAWEVHERVADGDEPEPGEPLGPRGTDARQPLQRRRQARLEVRGRRRKIVHHRSLARWTRHRGRANSMPRASSTCTASASVGQIAGSMHSLVEAAEGSHLQPALGERRPPSPVIQRLPVSRRDSCGPDRGQQVVYQRQPSRRGEPCGPRGVARTNSRAAQRIEQVPALPRPGQGRFDFTGIDGGFAHKDDYAAGHHGMARRRTRRLERPGGPIWRPCHPCDRSPHRRRRDTNPPVSPRVRLRPACCTDAGWPGR